MNKINRPIYPFGIEHSFHCECCEKTLKFSELAIAGHYISEESFFICQNCVEDFYEDMEGSLRDPQDIIWADRGEWQTYNEGEF